MVATPTGVRSGRRFTINKGNSMPAGRTAFADNVPVTSKAVRRYGSQGSKTDYPDSSTGENPTRIHPDEVPPSAPSHSNTERAVVQARTSGWDPATGKWLGASHPNTGKHDGGHEPARIATTDNASGQMHSASGGKFGKPQQRPGPASNTGTRRMYNGALAGDSGPRTSCSGGKGFMR
jgi:hypothetical protein